MRDMGPILKKLDDLQSQVSSLISQRDKFYRQVEEMQKTLEWYADTSNHSPFSSLMREDCGSRARQALKGESQ